MFGFLVHAQKDTFLFAGKGKLYQDSLVLRWNALSSHDFIKGFESGYGVELYERHSDGMRLIERKEIHPWLPVAAQKTTLDSSSMKILGVIYMLKNLEVPASDAGFGSLKSYHDQRNMLWGFLSLLADMNPQAADAAGLRYVFRDRKEDKEYTYRLYALSSNFISDTLIGGFYAGKPEVVTRIPQSVYTTEGERHIQFKILGDKRFSAYWLEKKTKGSTSFKRVNETPELLPAKEAAFLEFTDSVATNYMAHEYRMVASDMFGDLSYSDVFKAMGRDKTPPMVQMEIKGTPLNDSTIKVEWKLIDGNKSDVHRIRLSRSELNSGPYFKVAEFKASVGSVLDTADMGASGYFYLLEAIDTAGNATPFYNYTLLPDQSPPQQPLNVRAIVDSNGVVLLDWDHVPDSDVDGYLIFKANSLKHEFSGVVSKPQKKNYFFDTLALNMLNRDVYYRVIAVDRHFNRSKASVTVKVMRPDTLAPVPPRIDDAMVHDSMIELKIQPSSSVDVQIHYVYRSLNGKVLLIDSLKSLTGVQSYFDRTGQPGKVYTYFVVAKDETGNVSQAGNSVTLKLPEAIQTIEAIPMVNIEYDSTKKRVTVKWKSAPSKNAMIHLYRGTSVDSLQYLRTLPANQLQYNDLTVVKGTWYYSAVFADEKGRTGKMTQPLLFRIE